MPATLACSHCHLPILADDVHHRDGERVFCCLGCVSARAVIDGLGLTRFDTLGGAPGPVKGVEVDERAQAELEACLDDARQATSDDLCQVSFDVDGVSCASCAWLVEKVAAHVDGVCSAALNPARGVLELSVSPSFRSTPLAAALASVGHRLQPPGRGDSAGRLHGDDLVVRLGLTAVLSMTSMIASFSLFLGLSPHDDFFPLFVRLAGGASIIAVAVGGWPFFRGAWSSLRHGAPTMDVPIATGMIAATAANLLAAQAGSIVSFDTVAIFVTLMLAGRLVERRLVWRHRELLTRNDASIEGLQVRVLDDDGRLSWRAVKDVMRGDRLSLARGELVPVDGVIDGGTDHDVDADPWMVSFAWLTGESEPVPVGVAAAIPAGAHIVDARGCVVKATRPFSSTRLSALLAQAPRGPGVDDEDRSVTTGLFPWLARSWVAFAFGVALLGAIVWRASPPAELLSIVAALLVVTCPCAFGIAAPLAVERATVLLRERGVFVRHPRLWWRAFSVRVAVFDKTGTLTEDEPVVEPAGRHALAGLSLPARRAVAAVVHRSNHGRARALARALDDERSVVGTASVHETPGHGVVGQLDDLHVVVGRDSTDEGRTRIEVTHPDGHSECVVVGFTEALRHGAAAAIARLRDAGVDVWVASGDGAVRTRALAERVGIASDHVVAPCLPDDKAALVSRLGKDVALVVGDGVNDAAMFAVAAVSGVPATDRPHLPARADFVLLGSSSGGAFGSVVDVIEVARRLRRALVVLLSIATVYNVAVVAAGLLGALTPLLVALLMPAMSVSLLLLALVLVRAPMATSSSAASVAAPSLARSQEVPA